MISGKTMHPSGPSSNLTGVLMRRRNLDRERHPCDGYAQRKGWVGTQQAQGKGFRRNLAFPHLDLGLPASRKWCEKTNFCRVSHSVSGVLLWQPQQTDTSVYTLLSSDRPKASHCITSRSWSSYKDLQGLYHPAFMSFLLLYSSSSLSCSFCSSHSAFLLILQNSSHILSSGPLYFLASLLRNPWPRYLHDSLLHLLRFLTHPWPPCPKEHLFFPIVKALPSLDFLFFLVLITINIHLMWFLNFSPPTLAWNLLEGGFCVYLGHCWSSRAWTGSCM